MLVHMNFAANSNSKKERASHLGGRIGHVKPLLAILGHFQLLCAILSTLYHFKPLCTTLSRLKRWPQKLSPNLPESGGFSSLLLFLIMVPKTGSSCNGQIVGQP